MISLAWPRASSHLGLFRLRDFEGLGALFGGSETVSDFLLTFFDHAKQRRPDEFHAEPDEDDHGDRLTDQCGIYIHNTSPQLLCCKHVQLSDRKANVSAAHCRLKLTDKRVGEGEEQRDTDTDHGTASSSATTRNIFVCNIGASSG